MASIYIITSGSHSDYSIASVWSSRDEAEKICHLLNVGKRWEEFRVEEYPLDEIHDRGDFAMVTGFKAFYDFEKHGLHVDVSKVVLEEALYRPFQNSRVTLSRTFVSVLAESKEKGLRILFDAMAEHRAKEEGLTP